MGKTSIKDIEKDKIKLINGLRKNSKENLDVLGGQIGCSRQKIWRMVRVLEKKIIWGYTIVFSRELIGLKHFMITINLNAKPLSEKFMLKKIRETISDEIEKQIKTVSLDCFFYTHGQHDIFIEISAKDIKEALKVREFICQKIGDYIADVRVSEVVFNLVETGIRNPEIKKFDDFYKE